MFNLRITAEKNLNKSTLVLKFKKKKKNAKLGITGKVGGHR